MVYSMYKPIAEDDSETICALMLLYRKYYRVIGAIIGVVGVALTPVIPSLISGGVPEGINIYVLYLLHLSATVASYWLFAYKDSLLTAHQRVDIASKVTIVTTTLQYVLQFVALAITRNYYLYLIVSLGAQVINNIVKAIIATNMYPNYSPKGEMDSEVVAGINRRIKETVHCKSRWCDHKFCRYSSDLCGFGPYGFGNLSELFLYIVFSYRLCDGSV